MVYSVVCVCTVHAGECKVVDTHVCAGRGQGRMLGVFFNHTLPYCLGTEALTELEAHCSDLPSPPTSFQGLSVLLLQPPFLSIRATEQATMHSFFTGIEVLL